MLKKDHPIEWHYEEITENELITTHFLLVITGPFVPKQYD